MADEFASIGARKRRWQKPAPEVEKPVAEKEEAVAAEEKATKPKPRKKKTPRNQQVTVISPTPPAAPVVSKTRVSPHNISPYLTEETIQAIKTAIEAAENDGDYTHKSMQAVIRAAMFAFLDDTLKMAAKPRPGRKRRVNVLLTEEEYERYNDGFEKYDRKKSEVIERVVVAFLRNNLKPIST